MVRVKSRIVRNRIYDQKYCLARASFLCLPVNSKKACSNKKFHDSRLDPLYYPGDHIMRRYLIKLMGSHQDLTPVARNIRINILIGSQEGNICKE